MIVEKTFIEFGITSSQGFEDSGILLKLTVKFVKMG
jgi:hypothetical protein